MEVLGFFAHHLIDTTFTDAEGITFVVESISRSQQAVVSSSNPVEKRMISQLDAFKEIIKSSQHGCKKGLYSFYVKTLAVGLYSRGAMHCEAMDEAKKALKFHHDRKRDLMHKSKLQQKESKAESQYLLECKDKVFAKSLESQQATVDDSLQKWAAKLQDFRCGSFSEETL